MWVVLPFLLRNNNNLTVFRWKEHIPGFWARLSRKSRCWTDATGAAHAFMLSISRHLLSGGDVRLAILSSESVDPVQTNKVSFKHTGVNESFRK